MSLVRYPMVSDWLALEGEMLVLRTGKVEIGQRISTALLSIVHEELSLPPELIRIAPVRTGESPDEGMTSGSNSIEQSGQALRQAAATLREALLRLAAQRMGGDPSEWSLEEGFLSRQETNRRLPLMELLPHCELCVPVNVAASPRPVPAATMAGLARPPMVGLTDMVRGEYRFVHDLEAPGMLHARMSRPPHAGAYLGRVNEELLASLKDRGLHTVRDRSFLAVAGEREWPTVKAARQLTEASEWIAETGLPEFDAFAALTTGNAVRMPVRDGIPRPNENVEPPLDGATHKARYERPYTMHASLAPSAALAQWNGRRLEVATHSQGIYPLRQSIAESVGLDLNQVVLTHVPGSGCYGHNGADDAAFEAALVAMALPNRPILLKWTREDEHCWEPYGPPQAVEICASTGADGKITGLSMEAIAGTYRGRPRPSRAGAGPAKLIANWFRSNRRSPIKPAPNLNRQGGMHRNLDPAYTIPSTRFVKNLVTGLPFRSSALRCLGAAPNIFAIECFIDELAISQNRDPLEYRLAHLEDPHGRAVLERLGEAISVLPNVGFSGGRGIAYAQYKNAMARVAVAVDVDVNDRAEIRLMHVTLVADAGRVVDPDGLTAQLEGGFLQGASWALYEEVRWNRDGPLSRDWDTYPVLRFDNMPGIDVTLLDHPGEPSVGAGEASPGPTIAAIGNALFAATRLRLRRLPFRPEAITHAALTD